MGSEHGDLISPWVWEAPAHRRHRRMNCCNAWAGCVAGAAPGAAARGALLTPNDAGYRVMERDSHRGSAGGPSPRPHARQTSCHGVASTCRGRGPGLGHGGDRGLGRDRDLYPFQVTEALARFE